MEAKIHLSIFLIKKDIYIFFLKKNIFAMQMDATKTYQSITQNIIKIEKSNLNYDV